MGWFAIEKIERLSRHGATAEQIQRMMELPYPIGVIEQYMVHPQTLREINRLSEPEIKQKTNLESVFRYANKFGNVQVISL